jgi:glutathione synthase/RimK-type ligase-like ATP-grasp enzyme
MWIKTTYIDACETSVFLPVELTQDLNKRATLVFGARSSAVALRHHSDLAYNKDSSYDEPISIYLSKDLQPRLLLPETQIYRAKIHAHDNTLSLGPVIGLLLGIHNHEYHPRHMQKYSDRFSVYNKIGGLIYAFSSNSIAWDESKAYGLYFNIETNKWEYGVFPLPTVIYRRDFHQPQTVIDRLKETTHGRLFNSYRFSKQELFEIIQQNNELALNLPETEIIKSFDQLKTFADKHQKVILKPNNLSRGRGICFLEKTGDNYLLSDYRTPPPFDTIIKRERGLLQFYNENTAFHEDYLVQKCIKLAQIRGAAFDIRVVTQKKNKETWSLSGIECRVSDPDSLVTNISRGGYALELDTALWHSFQDQRVVSALTKQIYEYCLNLCAHLDRTGEHFAELGLDIGIDQDQKIWLIEANVFPSFKGFKQMDYNTYQKIRYAPLLYARSLTEFTSLSDS